jgi:tetratricopeptide (TPR) repeat protein
VEKDCNAALQILDELSFPNANGGEISSEDRQQSHFQKLYSKVYLRRADCFTKQEKFQEAVREYEACVTLDPENRGKKKLTQKLSKH